MIFGIVGGMGPMATCDLFQKIIDSTDAASDQQHLHIVIDSNSQIPDRSAYLTGAGEDPRPEIIKTVHRLESMGCDIILMPCNTAHAFIDDIVAQSKAQVLDMIKETAEYCLEKFPSEKRFLLLASEGTYYSQIYQNTFAEYGLEAIDPDPMDRRHVMNWIYKVKAGDYSVEPYELKMMLESYGDLPVILGCSELPLLAGRIGVPEQYVDPASAIARKCAFLAGRGKEEAKSELASFNI